MKHALTALRHPPRMPAGHDRSMAVRMSMLVAGLVIQGVGIAAMVQAGLGVGAWDVLHAGLADLTGLSFGTVIVIVTLAILILWWPLRERPHIGTVLNVFVAAVVIDTLLANTTPATSLPVQVALMTGGLVLFALGQGMYLAPRLGVGAREGLMTGLNRQWGWSIRRSRTVVEVTVLLLGVALGGPVGVGTVLFTFLIGPLVQWFGHVFGYQPPAEQLAAPADLPPTRPPQLAKVDEA